MAVPFLVKFGVIFFLVVMERDRWLLVNLGDSNNYALNAPWCLVFGIVLELISRNELFFENIGNSVAVVVNRVHHVLLDLDLYSLWWV